MTTGYTSIIEEREHVTFPEFAMRCARAMMPCLSLREEPLDATIPEKLIPSSHCADRVLDLEQKLESLLTLDMDAAQLTLDKEHGDTFAWIQAHNVANAKKRAKFEAMRQEVANWVPPTADHENLKKFMLEQLDHELEFGNDLALPEKPTLGAWIHQQIEDAQNRLAGAKKDLADEEQRFA